ncbi:MAG: hypothetical protein K8U57_02190 [Planctomycetes bacterium]|nr:hypothetical protein [Planctomycetota bacterium]
MNPPRPDQTSRNNGLHDCGKLLTEEQRDFALLIGGLLAELWERRQRPQSARTVSRLERGHTTDDADGETRPA